MGDRTGIQWTDATWNPVVGCERTSPGCARCYAKQLHDMRRAAAQRGAQLAPQYAQPFETVQLMPERLTIPRRWRTGRRVFVNSVSDLFHPDVPSAYVDRVFAVMALAPQHTFQVLTKRAGRMRDYARTLAPRFGTEAGAVALLCDAFPGELFSIATVQRVARAIEAGGLPNVWLGVSVENQRWADERVPLLLDTPAAVRFLSCEPLLGPVDLAGVPSLAPAPALPWVDWVIVGGESGPRARPMAPEWARALRDQCTAAGIAYLFKQWGGRTAKSGGRVLDGRTWDEMPAPAHA